MNTLAPFPLASKSTAPRAIVAGGGVAGLAAAWHLARGGAAVTLLEGAGEPGGRAATRLDAGFSFNLGPHALYSKGEFKALLDAAGVAYEAGSPPVAGGLRALRRPAGRRCRRRPSASSPAASSGCATRRSCCVSSRGLPRLSPATWQGDSRWRMARWTLERRRRGPAPSPKDFSGSAPMPTHRTGSARKLPVRQAQRGLAGVLYVARRVGQPGRRHWPARCGRSARPSTRAPRWPASETAGGAASGVALRGRPGAAGGAGGAGPAAGRPAADAAGRRPPRASRRISRPPCRRPPPVSTWPSERLPSPELLFALGFDQPTYFSVHSAATRLAPPGKVLLHAARYLAPGEEPRRAEAEAALERPDGYAPARLAGARAAPPAAAAHGGAGQPAARRRRPAGRRRRRSRRACASPATGSIRLRCWPTRRPKAPARAVAELLAEAGIGQDRLRRTA